MRLKAAFLAAPGAQAVVAALARGSHRALFVGGCVRNALMDMAVSDIDIATDALPLQVTALAEAAGLAAHPTGIDHGTVTVVAHGVPHEVTTFRRDVLTDGRRAVVAFSDDIHDDAARRDFTMNALYAEADGTLVDPLGGLDDLRARRVRFVGDPHDRIAEDYLRILRFFRFHACYGAAGAPPDPQGLAACAAMAAGLSGLSRERIGHEMRRLLAAADPAPAVASMADAGVLDRVLPGAKPHGLAALAALERGLGLAPEWPRRLALLVPVAPVEALKLSRAEARQLAAIAAAGDAGPPAHAAYRHGAGAARDAALIAAACAGAEPPPGLLAEVARGAAAHLPVTAADLLPRHGEGPALGRALKALERRWIASDFTASRGELLDIGTGGAE